MKKILFVGDGLWTPSGFGTVMRNLISGLKSEYKVALQSWQFVGNKTEFDGVSIYPSYLHLFGKDVLPYVIEDFEPDTMITLGDYWMLNYLTAEPFRNKLREKNIKWIWYIPIDSEMIPPHFMPLLKSPDVLVTMAKFAHEMAKKEGINNVYIPHGVDLSLYRRESDEEREKCREEEGYNGKFVIGCVNRNQDRKQLPRLVEAFAKFAKDKDDVILHFHCDPYDVANLAAGYNNDSYPLLVNAIGHFGVAEKVHFSRQMRSFINGANFDEMRKIYNLFNITASSTSGEGFGLSTIESIACGVPIVITDYTSSKELVLNGGNNNGLLVDVKTCMFGGYGTMRAIVDIDDMVAKFQYLYDHPEEVKKMSDNCLNFAKQYAWSKIIPMWKEVIEDEK
jgi:glycosyltransferase involved in cell wall biosynthesis